MCACAPSLRVIFKSYLKSTLNRSNNSSQGGIRHIRGCCGNHGHAVGSDDPPPRAIELKRSVTVESDTPLADGSGKPYFRESVRSPSTSTTANHNSNRVGIVCVPRAYRQALAEEPHLEDEETARPRWDSYDPTGPVTYDPGWSQSTASVNTECHSCRAMDRIDAGQRTFFRSGSGETLPRASVQAPGHGQITPPLPPLPITALPTLPISRYHVRQGSTARSVERTPVPNWPPASLSAEYHDTTAPRMSVAEEDAMRPDSVMLAMMGRGKF